MLKVHSIETFGANEGPGLRPVLFLQGCQWRCLYCHNPDTQPLSGGMSMSVARALKLIDSQKEYYGGQGAITVSGGEPTLQAKELIKLFSACQRIGVHTALDTNGAVDSPEVRKLYDLTDVVLLDIKQIDSGAHKRLTGADNRAPLSLAAYREKSGKPFWVRYVLVPGYSDSPEDLNNFGEHFSLYKNLERVEILPYHTFAVYKYQELGKKYELTGVTPPTADQVAKAKRIMEKHLPGVFVR